MATVKLDVCYDNTGAGEMLSNVLHELTRDLDITFDATGIRDASGWPEIEFSGPVGDLEVLVHRYNGDNGIEEFGELLKLIHE